MGKPIVVNEGDAYKEFLTAVGTFGLQPNQGVEMIDGFPVVVAVEPKKKKAAPKAKADE